MKETIIETDIYYLKKWKWFQNKVFLKQSKCGKAYIEIKDFNKLIVKNMKNPHENIITWWDEKNKIPIIKTRWQNACEIAINKEIKKLKDFINLTK